MYESLESFPLRQINFVKTRTTILKVVMNLLKTKTFDEITVDEICQRAQISRGTFFNYFSNKNYIFYYYLRIFAIKIAQRIKHWNGQMSFREQLEQIYIWFDEENQYPRFISAYIQYLLDEGNLKNDIKLTAPEFVYFFTNIEGEEAYEYYNTLTIEDIIKDLCKSAKEKGELPGDIDDDRITQMYLSFLLAPFITSTILGVETPHTELFRIILDKILKE